MTTASYYLGREKLRYAPRGRPGTSLNRERTRNEGRWFSTVGMHHQLICVVDIGSLVLGWLWPRDALLEEVGELQGSPCRRPPSPKLRHGPPSNLLWMGRSAFQRPLRAGRDAGLQVGVPAREALRTLQHASYIPNNPPSVRARDGYMCVIFPRVPVAVPKRPTALGAGCSSIRGPSTLYMLAATTLSRDLTYTRRQYSRRFPTHCCWWAPYSAACSNHR